MAITEAHKVGAARGVALVTTHAKRPHVINSQMTMGAQYI